MQAIWVRFRLGRDEAPALVDLSADLTAEFAANQFSGRNLNWRQLEVNAERSDLGGG